MLKPKSYTREDVLELHTHGGGVCAQRVLRACIEAGARPARPGEFTLRAFLNGRLDLSQAESVLQLISARTGAAADSALAGLQGGLGELVSTLRQDLLEMLAELEARLDFDEDLPPLNVKTLIADIIELQKDMEAALRTSRQGNLLRQGLQVCSRTAVSMHVGSDNHLNTALIGCSQCKKDITLTACRVIYCAAQIRNYCLTC
eukprot:GHRR01036514.1.p1 GENE.GHRR01036514.1~~GHRR01036514.1.p1  ORF type:complete len:203 (+),score=26.63 GHRR01036514.1:339-947(+)